ncbi:NlpC/P60 family protein [Arthrobacter sp. AK04]|nr:NlpC/P60 family protein [Arthrobacter sp. AK04]
MTPIRIRQLTSQALGEATFVSSRHHSARHRAQTVRTNPLDTVSKAVSANAGTVGRQAAVIAAASGLILSMGLPANAADTTAGVSASTESGSAQSALAVTAAPTATVSFERPVVKTTAAPKPAPVRAQSTDSEDRAAAATRTASTATAPEAAAEKLAETVSSASTSGIAALAYTGIGRPYVWGGTTPNGWDCSGFTQWVYAQAGISIPRVNAWTAMTPTSTPQPGDLVMQNGGAHVGIYVGNGMMVSALNPSQGTLLHSVAATGSSAFFTINK